MKPSGLCSVAILTSVVIAGGAIDVIAQCSRDKPVSLHAATAESRGDPTDVVVRIEIENCSADIVGIPTPRAGAALARQGFMLDLLDSSGERKLTRAELAAKVQDSSKRKAFGRSSGGRWTKLAAGASMSRDISIKSVYGSLKPGLYTLELSLGIVSSEWQNTATAPPLTFRIQPTGSATD